MALSVSSSAAESFSWKELDNGYVTFIYDDGNDIASLSTIAKKYNIPFCFSIIGKTVDPDNNQRNLVLTKQLLELQNRGCEILSHTYSHNAFSEESDVQTIEQELSLSYTALTKAGFVVNGIIEAGSGGGENKVDYNLVEAASQKYYKYSDSYGTSPQYKFERTWMSKLGTVKGAVNKAQRNKSWLVLSAHSLKDLSASELENLIEYITKEKGMQIVTVKYMYENFGQYPTAQDFGPTYYTVDFLSSEGEILKSEVVKAGDEVPTGPEGYSFESVKGTVQRNMSIKQVEGNSNSVDGQSGSLVGLWISIGAVALIIIAVTVIIILKKK